MAAEQCTIGEQVIRLFSQERLVRVRVHTLERAAEDEVTKGEARRRRLLGDNVLADLMDDREPVLNYPDVKELESGLLVSRARLEAYRSATEGLSRLRVRTATQISGLLQDIVVTATKLKPEDSVFAQRQVGERSFTSGIHIKDVAEVTGELSGVDEKFLGYLVLSDPDSGFEWSVAPLDVEGMPQVSLHVELPMYSMA